MKRTLTILGLGLSLGVVSGGCSSEPPEPTEEAKLAEQKAMEELTIANDAAAKAAKSNSQPKTAVMPP